MRHGGWFPTDSMAAYDQEDFDYPVCRLDCRNGCLEGTRDRGFVSVVRETDRGAIGAGTVYAARFSIKADGHPRDHSFCVGRWRMERI